MQKRVERKEVTVHVGAKSSVSNSPQLPDASTLAARYGLEDDISDCDDELSSAADAKPSSNPDSPSRLNSDQLQKQAQLLQRLESKNRQIEQLCVMLEALQPAPGVDAERVRKAMATDTGAADGDSSVDLRDSKIVALAKKSHNLQMQLNKERAKCENLSQQLAIAEKSCDGLKEELTVTKALVGRGGTQGPKVYNRNAQSTAAAVEEDDAQQTALNLRKELKETGKVVDELKRKLALSSEENKQLTRALNRELGDGVSLDQAVSGGWRGRAQQIVMLKAKIKKLEADGMSTTSSRYGGRSVAPSDVDSKAEEDLAAMSNERRQIVEALTEERVQLIESTQQLEKKNQAQKARIHILETDTKKLRENLQLVIEKSENDDKLLEALRKEVQRLKGEQQTSVIAAGRDAASGTLRTSKARQSGLAVINHSTATANKGKEQQNSLDSDAKDARLAQQQEELLQCQNELQRLRRLCKNQAEQLDSQDQTIRQLKKKISS